MIRPIPVNLPDIPVMTKDKAIARVAKIDKMFEEATGWGSWMVEAANEREHLATSFGLPQKYQARSGSGGRVD